MRIKRATTIALSFVAALSATIGTVAFIKSAASQPLDTKTPVATVTGNEAYLVGKSESIITYGKDNNSDVMGLKAKLFNEDTLTLRNVIDLNDMYKKGQTFLEILPVAEEVGFADYKTIFIEMVDVYDKDNFLKIKMSTNPDGEDESSAAYFLACANNGQRLTGYEWNGDPKSTGTLHINNDYGQWSYYWFGDQEGARSGTGFYYDVVNKSVYAQPLNGNVKRQIIDFDDPNFFGSYLWEGFTSNEVYCTIRCVDYKRETASFLVSKYGDYELSKMEATDVVAPILDVDLGGYTEESLPKGLLNYSYPLFHASARDAFDGEIDAAVEVTFAYDTTNPKQMTVKNGAFKPTEPGRYRITYSATDSHGNIAKKNFYVDVEMTHPKLEVAFDDITTEMMEGDLYTFPSYTVLNAFGNPQVELQATLNGKELEITEKGIRPYDSGEMQVTYVVKDYVGRKVTQTYTVTVNKATKPTFVEEPLLPKRLIAGNSYVFPSIFAYNYVTGQGEPVATQIYVKENGVEKAIENGKYVAGELSEVEVIYRATVGQAVGEWSVTLPVYNVKTNGYLDMSKYFLPMDDKGSVESTLSAVDLCVTEDTKFEFVNYVTTYPFITEFTYGENVTNIGKFHIYLTDIQDARKFLKFTYDFKGGIVSFYLNDNQNLTSGVTVGLKKDARNQLIFKAEEHAVSFDINKNSAFPVSTFYEGQAFTGFTNERVYVTYEFEGVKGDARIGINNLNLTYLSNDNGDYMAPLVSLLGKVGGEREINEVVDLPKIISNDVFAGDVAAYITVKTPNGQFATTLDGKVLNNYVYDQSSLQVKLTEYGKYEVHVTAEDDAGNTGLATMVIRVVDMQPPKVTLSKDVPETAKVGKKVKLPSAKVEDNFSQNCTVKLYVFNPSGHVLALEQGDDGFIATSAGIYTIVYYAMDEAGNFTSLRFTITVK